MNIQLWYFEGDSFLKFNEVLRPSRRMMVGDYTAFWMWNGRTGVHDIYPHNDGMDIVFLDGHVEWFLGPLPGEEGTWDFPW